MKQPDSDTPIVSPSEVGTRRLLDAVGNRLEEALRVIEDQLRFRHGLSAAPRAWREIRHEASALRRSLVGEHALPLSRDTASDPGHPGRPPQGGMHDGPDAVLAANLARAREAMRSIEEELRQRDPSLGRTAERLRYRIYALEAAALGFLSRRDRLAGARLYVLVTSALCQGSPEEVTAAAIDGGAQVIQLREKEMEGRELLSLAERLRAITAAAGVPLIINDRVEIARLCGADGVHLGQGDILPLAARRILGPEAIIGLSTHAPEEAARAAIEGADYIGVGPIHETRTKEHREAVGLGYIEAAREVSDLPGFAIGAVGRSTIEAVLGAGARRVAICTAIIGAADVRGEARFFRGALDRAVAASSV